MALDGMKNDIAAAAQEMSLDAINKAENVEKNTLIIKDMTALSSFKNIISKRVMMTLTAASVTFWWAAFGQDTTKISDTNKPTSSLTLKETDPQDPIYTEKVKMPDGSVFMVSKEELKWLKDYEELLAEWVYENRNEMLVDFKKQTLWTRSRAWKVAEIVKLEEENKKKKAEWEIIKQRIAEKEKIISANREESRKRIKQQLWNKQVSEQKLNELDVYLDSRTESYGTDQALVTDLEKKGIVTAEQKKQLQAIVTKWQNFSNTDLPVLEKVVQDMVNRASNLLAKWVLLVQK